MSDAKKLIIGLALMLIALAGIAGMLFGQSPLSVGPGNVIRMASWQTTRWLPMWAVGVTGPLYTGPGQVGRLAYWDVPTGKWKEWTGSVPVGMAFGGNWKTYYSDGTGYVKELALGTTGSYLKSTGTGGAPTFDNNVADTTYTYTTTILEYNVAQNTNGARITVSTEAMAFINTEVIDEGNFCTVNGDSTFTLAAGTYDIEANANICHQNTSSGAITGRFYLEKTSDGSTLVTGMTFNLYGYGVIGSPPSGRSITLNGRFVLASSTTCAITVRQKTTSGSPIIFWGGPFNIAGLNEVYAQVIFRRYRR